MGLGMRGRRPGRPFPDRERLAEALQRRFWSMSDWARAAGVSVSLAQNAVIGRNLSDESIEALAKALLENPPPEKTATAAWVAGEVA